MDLGREKRIFGKLGSMSLADIVQILGVNKRTATLTLTTREESGTIFLKDGIVLHAALGVTQGENAILQLLEWPSADFIIEEGISSLPTVTMSADAEAIMLKMCSKLDEAKRARHEPSSSVHRAASKQVLQATTEALKRKKEKKRTRGFKSMLAEPERRRVPMPMMAVLAVGAMFLTVYLPGKFLSKGSASTTEIPSSADVPEVVEEPVASTTESPEFEAAGKPMAIDTDTNGETPPGPVAAEPPLANPAPASSPADLVTPAPSRYGHLLVIVDPWAEVTVDGKTVGETPLNRIRLRAGRHDLTLSNDNFAGVITDRIDIAGDETLTQKYTFNDFGYLQVVVSPWADVFIDGKRAGQTPFGKLKVPVGRHRVTLEHPELGEKNTEVDIRSNETTLLKLEM